MKLLVRRFLHRLLAWLLRIRSQPYAPSENAKCLVIAPHQDDEALGCAGLISSLRSAGIPVQVLYLTDGSGSHPNHPKLSPEKLSVLRDAEAQTAMKMLGVDADALAFLRGKDGSLAHLDAASAGKVVAQLTSRFAAAAPTEIFITYSRDGSSEHEAAFLLVRQAIKAANISPRVLEFPIWSWWNPLLLLPHVFRFRRVWRVQYSDRIELKRAVLATYRSQVAPIEPWTTPLLSASFLSFFSKPEEFFFET